MEQIVTEMEYAVGLTREEYVRSQQLVEIALRRRRKSVQRVFSIILMVFCLLSVAVEYRMSGQVDPEIAVVVLLMIVVEIWAMLDTPRLVRQGHEAAYDMSLFSGHSFDGALTVDAKGLVKRTADETNRLSFNRCAAFIEAEDMMLFCVNSGKSIVIPARCLTPEDAEFTKRLAMEAISPAKRYILAEIEPKLETRQPIGDLSPVAEEPLLCVSVEYTTNELKSNMTDIAIRTFFEKIVNKLLQAVLFTMLAYFSFKTAPLPLFLLGVVLLFVLDILMARYRARRAIDSSGGDVCRLRLELTDRYLTVIGRGEKARRLQIPWERITRAVERPQEVEFFVEKARVVTIPKRCIPDMEQLRSIVDAHMKQI